MKFPGLNDKAFQTAEPSQQSNNYYQFDNTQELAAKLGEQLQVIHDRQNPTWQEGIQRQFDNIETTLNSPQADEHVKAQRQLIKIQLSDRLSIIYNWLIDHRPQHQNITTKHQQVVNKLQEQLTKCVEGFVESAESVMDVLYTPTTLEEILCKTRTQLLYEFIQRNIDRYTSLIGHEIHNSQYIQNIAYHHYGTQYSQNYARTYFNTDDTTIRSNLQSFFETNYQLHHLVDYIINSIHTQAQQHYGDNYQAEYFKDQVYDEDSHDAFITSITNISNIQLPCNIFDFDINEDADVEIAGINWAYIRYAIWEKLIQDQFINPEPDYTNLNNPQERDKAIYYLISLAKMRRAFSQQQLANEPEEVVSQAKTNINQALQKVESNLGDQLESWLADALKTVMSGDLDRGFPAVFQIMQEKECSSIKHLMACLQRIEDQLEDHQQNNIADAILNKMSQEISPQLFFSYLYNHDDSTNSNSVPLINTYFDSSPSAFGKFISKVFAIYYQYQPDELIDQFNQIIQNQGIEAFLPYIDKVKYLCNNDHQMQLLDSIMDKLDLDTFSNISEHDKLYKIINTTQLDSEHKAALLKWACFKNPSNLNHTVTMLGEDEPLVITNIIDNNFLHPDSGIVLNIIDQCLKRIPQAFSAFLAKLNELPNGEHKLWRYIKELDFKAFDKLLNYAQEHSYDNLRQTLIKNIDAFTLQTLLSNKPQHRLKYQALCQQRLPEIENILSRLSVTDFTNNELQLFLNALSNSYQNVSLNDLIRDWLMKIEDNHPLSHFIQSIILEKPDIQLDQLNSKALDIITKKEVHEEHYKTILGKERFELARSLFDTKLYELSKEHRHSPKEYHFHKRKKIENLLTITVELETYNKQRCHQFFSHLINQLDPIDKYRVLNEVWSNAIGSDNIYAHFLELAIIAWSPGDSTEFIKRLIEGSPVIANERMSGKHYKNVGIKHILQTQYIQAILQQDHNLAKLLQNSQHLQNGETPLTQAIKDDDLERAQDILHESACINQRNKDNEFPLHIAIENNQTELVRYLIQQGADVVKPKTNMGNVAPTANNPQDLTEDETIRKLVEDNQPDERGHTKLSKAIMKEDSDTINEQLQQGANVNHLIYEDGKQEPPKTPLYYALSKNRLDIAQQLLQKGARLQIATDKSDGRFNVPYKDYSHEHPEYLFGHLNLLKQSHEIWENAKFQNLNSYIENHIENLLEMISEDIANEGDSKCIDQFTHKQWCKDDRDNYWKILSSTNDRVERYKRLPISNMQQWLRDNAYIQQNNQPIDFSQLLVDLKATLQSEVEHLSDSQQQQLQQLETMSQHVVLYSNRLKIVLNNLPRQINSTMNQVWCFLSNPSAPRPNNTDQVKDKIDEFQRTINQNTYTQIKQQFNAIMHAMAQYTYKGETRFAYTSTLRHFHNQLKSNNQTKQFDLLIKGLDHIKQQNNINQDDLTFDNLLAQASQQLSLDRSQERGAAAAPS